MASWTFSIVNYDFLFHHRETSLWKRGSYTEVNKFDLQVAWEEVIFKDYQNRKNKNRNKEKGMPDYEKSKSLSE